MNHDLENELDLLAGELRDTSLSPESSGRLEELITKHPELRRRFAEHLALNAALVEEASSRPDWLSEPGSAENITPWKQIAAWSSLAASIALALFLALQTEENTKTLTDVNQPIDAASANTDRHGIAVLVRSANAQWKEHTPVNGQTLSAGTYHLARGMAEMNFYCGATAIIEGPAEIELVTPELAILHKGKVHAQVPPSARGFTLRHGSYDVVDLGTEFGLVAHEDGTAQVHVMDGEVRVDRDQSATHILAGEAMALSNQGLEAIPVAGNKFSDPVEFDKLVKTEAASQHAAWQKSMETLRVDPSLLALYTFESSDKWRRTLPNTAPRAPKNTAGAIVGCTWNTGRWQGKSALSFSSSRDRVSVEIPGTHSDLTLSMWVRINSFSNQNTALLRGDSGVKPLLHWVLRQVKNPAHTAKVFLMDNNGKNDRQIIRSTQPAYTPDDRFRWMHFVTVKDSANGKVTHYLNGEVIGEGKLEKNRPVRIGRADLGNWPYKEWAKDTSLEIQNLDGMMDEFAVLTRPLAHPEIRQLYKAGKP